MSSKPVEFSRPSAAGRRREKAAGIRRRFLGFCAIKEWCRSEPLSVALAVMIPARPAIAIVATIAVTALGSPMPPTLGAEAAFHMGQHGEAAFLALVEGLVKRVSRVRDLLQ